MQFTVYFDPPFWIGVLEETRDGTLYAAQHLFGAEPTAQQIYAFVQNDLDALRAQMTAGVAADSASRARRKNPKRVQREIRRELARAGVTRKAHDAIRQQIETHKQARQQITRGERKAQRAHKRRVRQEKARQKRRGH